LADTEHIVTVIPAGELPLQPVINAPWAVAGVVLILAGAVYALIGIRIKWLHTFFSTAFLASLGTTVLIIYVMTPPVSMAVQGAYVVAVVMTGGILGGVAMIFKEVTEGLGCILGGFSLAMWLLTQTDGGILPTTTGRIIFICAFCAGTFGFYFSHYTRNYALIGSIAFGGASAAVLGIDCFSRAGLKEFWVYLWAVNSNVFPLGTDTYPLTRGIRVELAATFLLFLAGIVSQLRLWRVIKERRAKRDEARQEARRQREADEEAMGRQIEAGIADDRRRWEAARGDGTGRVGGSTDSGVGDLDSEKRVRHSLTGTVKEVASVVEEPIEMSELPANEDSLAPARTIIVPAPTAAETLLRQDENGVVTVRVATDDHPHMHMHPHRGAGAQGPAEHVDGSGQSMPAVALARDLARSRSPGLEVVPMPFRVPEVNGDAEHDNRSSLAATFADEDLDRPGSRRSSFAKRLSVGSAKLLRSLSQRSRGTNVEALNSPQFRESREDLVRAEEGLKDDSSSVAVAMDDMEDDEDETPRRDGGKAEDIEIKADMGAKGLTAAATSKSEAHIVPGSANVRHSVAETVATSILAGPMDGGASQINAEKAEEEYQQNSAGEEDLGKGAAGKSRAGASVVSSSYSARGSLTKGNLPRALSRVAMSYRTNEWAKHLSNAELPQADELQLQPEEDADLMPTNEHAAPLNVAQLQQTADDGAPPIAAPRSETVRSAYVQNQGIGRADSRVSLLGEELRTASTTPTNPYRAMSSALARRTSGLPQPITEETYDKPEGVSEEVTDEDHIARASPAPQPNLASRPPVPGVVSYDSPQTLIGQREMLLRNKSQTAFYVPPHQTPESLNHLGSPPASQVGSMVNLPAYAALSGQSTLESVSSAMYSPDDLTLTQRRELIRQSSLSSADLRRESLGLNQLALSSAPAITASSAASNSHQPQRVSTLPSALQRESALANFRSSVAADLRAGSPALGMQNRVSSSMSNLPSAYGHAAAVGAARKSTIEIQRGKMLAQRDAEAQRRESERAEKERMDLVFGERMRMSGMLEAHREKMRRMQSAVRDS
jgi:hypothetical protein